MEPNTNIVDALLKNIAKDPTGFSAGQTIYYGAADKSLSQSSYALNANLKRTPKSSKILHKSACNSANILHFTSIQ